MGGRRAGFGAGSGAARGASAGRARAVRADGGPGHDGRAPGVRPGIDSLLCNRLYDASVRPMARQYIVAPAGRRAPRMRRSSPLARSVDIDRGRNATERPGGRPLRARVRVRPRAAAVRSGGLPRPAVRPRTGAPAAPRWILLGSSIEVDLAGHGPASHVVVAHLCDAWRDDAGRRPAGLAVGHVVPVGEPLARYTVVDRSGRSDEPAHPAPVRGQRGHPRLGLRRVRRDPASRERGPGLARTARRPGSGPLRPARPVGVAHDHARHVRRQPGRDVRLRAEPRWRRAPVAPRDPPGARGGARRPPPRVADGRPAGERRDPGRRDRLPRLRQPAGPRPAHGRPDRGPRRSRRPRSTSGTVIRTRPSDEAAGGTSDGGIVGWGRPRRAGTDDAARARRRGAVQRGRPVDRPGRHHQPRRLGRAGERAAGRGPRRDPAGTRSIEVLPAARIPVEVQVVDRSDRRAGPEPGPLHRRRRALPAAGRPSRRDQPGVLRGHRRRPHPRVGRLCLRPRPVHHRAAARRGRRRGRRRVRPGPDADAARGGALDAPPRAVARPDDRPPRRAMGHRRHARPLPRPVDGPPAGGRRGRRRRQSAGRPMGRPVHERDRPAVGLDGRSGGPADRRGRDGEPPEPARPPGAPRGPPADPPVRERRPARGPPGGRPGRPAGRLGGSLPRRRRPRRGRPLPAAVRGDRGRHRGGQDRRARDAGARARARRPGRPRVVPLPRPGLPAADRGRHGQDVVGGPGRGGPGVRPPAVRRPAQLRHVGGGRPRGTDVRDVGPDPRARRRRP